MESDCEALQVVQGEVVERDLFPIGTYEADFEKDFGLVTRELIGVRSGKPIGNIHLEFEWFGMIKQQRVSHYLLDEVGLVTLFITPIRRINI